MILRGKRPIEWRSVTDMTAARENYDKAVVDEVRFLR